MERPPWQELAASQAGLLARRQLNELGYLHHYVRRQLDAGRWVERTSTVVSTTTGPSHRDQLFWLGPLHAGGDALVGGLSALERHGLKNWHRDDVTVLVDDERVFDPVPGLRFVRTRRPLSGLRDSRSELPLCRVEAAALLFAGYERSIRTAEGLLAAVVQQRLTDPALLLAELEGMRPLRRARLFRGSLRDIAGGAGSLAEIDLARVCRRFSLPEPRRQVRRRDSSGRVRFTDAEWLLPDGRVLVLEVDGAFHMDAEQWEDDIARARGLAGPDRLVVRCTSRELRDTPEIVVRDLRALGLSQSCADPHSTLRGRNCTEIRGPAWATFGTAWSQVRWQEPPITTRSPCPISTDSESPPPRGRSASRRGSPSDTIATIVSWSRPRPIRSPCQATLSRPSR
jgi:hypothetical protein